MSCSITAGHRRCSLPSWWTAATASCRSARTSSARMCRLRSARASACGSRKPTASTACCCAVSRSSPANPANPTRPRIPSRTSNGGRAMSLAIAHPAERPLPAIFPRRHLLDLDDWTPDELRALLDAAATMREVRRRPERKLDTLRGHVLVNLFYENSTRTRISFELAGKRLGADVVNVTASGSSVTNSESLRDTVRTLQALRASILVVRSGQSRPPDPIARAIHGAVINAGDGWHPHPPPTLLVL